MIITAKYNGFCAKCGKPTPKGSEIDYQNKQAFHPACVKEEEGWLPDADQLALATKLGYRHVSWLDLLPLPLPASDELEWDGGLSRGRDSVRGLPSSDTCSITDLRGSQDY